MKSLTIDEIVDVYNTNRKTDFDWDEYINSIEFSTASDDVFDFILSHNMGLVALSHKNIPNKWLIKLARLGFDEALFQLGKKLSCGSDDDCLTFAGFINEFSGNYDLFVQLLEFHDLNREIRNIMLYYGRNSMNNEVRRYVQAYIDAEIASITTNQTVIISAYNSGEYHSLLAISQNLFTPNWILEELLLLADVKFAKKIRSYSRSTLDKKRSIGQCD